MDKMIIAAKSSLRRQNLPKINNLIFFHYSCIFQVKLFIWLEILDMSVKRNFRQDKSESICVDNTMILPNCIEEKN